ncbi:hypothetical protein CC85DRAFT_281616 [Cutaneotrichosporon oleaginosum]|uniref:Uncharacterized protein n=1 Tax=Cutaneotrichosporon oleaginosum TaxID=879819 RepID=A0A0J0XZP2_9TREE|nr:uncharacterized protein CC85DRAFT_281616 [Cutaneotrichosporon oleaginosum]KLT46510.1 hypothetical protein CC85DRAFT_281616 [Cutaneotrichosporon oleaginosum]TXT15123.1 hypothetical protein COLE_01316 [Cutaneotrichosporon oleaginosum]
MSPRGALLLTCLDGIQCSPAITANADRILMLTIFDRIAISWAYPEQGDVLSAASTALGTTRVRPVRMQASTLWVWWVTRHPQQSGVTGDCPSEASRAPQPARCVGIHTACIGALALQPSSAVHPSPSEHPSPCAQAPVRSEVHKR